MILIILDKRKLDKERMMSIQHLIEKFKNTTGYTDYNPAVFKFEEELCEMFNIKYEKYHDYLKTKNQKRRMA